MIRMIFVILATNETCDTYISDPSITNDSSGTYDISDSCAQMIQVMLIWYLHLFSVTNDSGDTHDICATRAPDTCMMPLATLLDSSAMFCEILE